LIGFNAKTVDLEDFEPEMLKECSRAIFVMATYGEGLWNQLSSQLMNHHKYVCDVAGDPTDNAAKFYSWMKNENEELNDDELSNLKYTVFGLGLIAMNIIVL
jgi:sulfite reductase alpha subunit-like flavoprotein